jgi:RND family efflux transporter MFP subunit
MKVPIFLFFALFLVSCGKESVETEQQIRPIKYGKVVLSTGMETYTFSGVTKAQNETNLSFKVAGTLSAVKVNLGDQVKKGQLIATIDPADYTIQTNQAISQKEGAIANAKAAEAQLISAKSTYSRVAQLYESNSVALSEYQQAKAGLDAAQAQYDAANSQIKATDQQVMAAGNQVSYTRLVAPMDGVITAVEVESNEVVNAGVLIAKVSSLGRPEVEVGIPEAAINKFKTGQKAMVTFPSLPANSYEAEIVEISFTSGKSTTFPVKLKIVNPADEIRPGMAAEVVFTVDNKGKVAQNEIFAPIKAVASGTEGNYVFKLIPDKEEGVYAVEKVLVELGSITEDRYVIRKGLNEGDLVAVAGLRSLYDGKKVKLLKQQ